MVWAGLEDGRWCQGRSRTETAEDGHQKGTHLRRTPPLAPGLLPLRAVAFAPQEGVEVRASEQSTPFPRKRPNFLPSSHAAASVVAKGMDNRDPFAA